MKKKNGFTLIELLAVIIILGILMIIAIPSVTKYISDSRKSSYVDTAKEVANATRNLVNSGKLEMYDTTVAYYIPNTCIKVENGDKAKSPYGDFIDDRTYVVVTYDGKGYDYYWVSLDETGTGVKEPISIDILEEKDIETDLTRDDVRDDNGVGKEKVVIFNSTCDASIPKDAYSDAICKRATTLHTEICYNNGCKNAGYVEGNKGTTISYGNLGTKGTLKPGDAFDCDVNGDGEFDSINERFYYVSDYYDTEINQFNSSYAVLSYYTGVKNGSSNNNWKVKYYSGVNENWHGPISLMNELPSIEQWNNIKLLKVDRLLINELGGYTSNNGNNQLEIINYQYDGIDRAARILTFQELAVACNINISTYRLEKIYSCDFLLEKTGYASGQNGYWLENASSSDNFDTYYVLAAQPWVSKRNPTDSSQATVRPVIEISKSKMEQ